MRRFVVHAWLTVLLMASAGCSPCDHERHYSGTIDASVVGDESAVQSICQAFCRQVAGRDQPRITSCSLSPNDAGGSGVECTGVVTDHGNCI